MLVDLGVNPLPVKGFRSQWIYTQFDRLNSTARIGCKSIEIDAGRFGCKSIEITLPVKGFRSQWIYTQFDRSNWVELGVNPLR